LLKFGQIAQFFRKSTAESVQTDASETKGNKSGVTEIICMPCYWWKKGHVFHD